MMKNAFLFTLKAFLILKISKFLYWLFGHVGKRLDQKEKVDFKIYDIRIWVTKNCNAIHVFRNMSRSKGNQTTKFGQLIEYNTRNILLEK